MAGYQLPASDVRVANEVGMYVPGGDQHVEVFTVDHGQANVILGTKFSQLVLVFVEPGSRRQGTGNALLDQVHAWADEQHRHLWLTPTQISPDGPDEATLTSWYERRGWAPFEVNGESALARLWAPR